MNRRVKALIDVLGTPGTYLEKINVREKFEFLGRDLELETTVRLKAAQPRELEQKLEALWEAFRKTLRSEEEETSYEEKIEEFRRYLEAEHHVKDGGAYDGRDNEEETLNRFCEIFGTTKRSRRPATKAESFAAEQQRDLDNARADLWALQRKVDGFRERLGNDARASATDLSDERTPVVETVRAFNAVFGAEHSTGPITDPDRREECDGCAFLGITNRGVRWCKNGGRPGRRIEVGVIAPGDCPAASLPRRNDVTTTENQG